MSQMTPVHSKTSYYTKYQPKNRNNNNNITALKIEANFFF